MKTFNCIVLLCCILAIGACKEDFQNDNGPVDVQNVHFIPCSSNSSNGLRADNGESIRFVAISDNSLRIEQDVIANCCMEEFEVQQPVVKNGQIFINQYTKGDGCNCVCLTKTSFEVENLIKNRTYVFVIKKNDLDYYSCKVTFTSSTDVIFTIL